MPILFPFSAIVGQDEMKIAILIAAVDPSVGGVLPPMRATVGCHYACDPSARDAMCENCQARRAKGPLKGCRTPVPVVDLPLGATEDRIVGALDLERALSSGVKNFEPGVLARAHRGFLYVDEVNLLEDHLVDLLIDVAASGENVVEREGPSVRHPARFVLIGSGNPEEGELRPQLLDRFGLMVEVKTPQDIETRVEVVRRRDIFDQDRVAFSMKWRKDEIRVRKQVVAGQKRLASISVPDGALEKSARLCATLGIDGLRGELTMIRAARALASFEGREAVSDGHLRKIAPLERDDSTRKRILS